MKQIIIQVIGRLATVAAVCLALDQTQVEAKPNVLFLFADDQCFETIGSLGLTDIDTPNLASDDLYLSRLKYTQERGLRGRAQLTDLIEQERATMGTGEGAITMSHAARICAGTRTEELSLQQPGW